MNKEKFLSESSLQKEPKKKLGLVIKDKAITAEKLNDGAITLSKLSDEVKKVILEGSGGGTAVLVYPEYTSGLQISHDTFGTKIYVPIVSSTNSGVMTSEMLALLNNLADRVAALEEREDILTVNNLKEFEATGTVLGGALSQTLKVEGTIKTLIIEDITASWLHVVLKEGSRNEFTVTADKIPSTEVGETETATFKVSTIDRRSSITVNVVRNAAKVYSYSTWQYTAIVTPLTVPVSGGTVTVSSSNISRQVTYNNDYVQTQSGTGIWTVNGRALRDNTITIPANTTTSEKTYTFTFKIDALGGYAVTQNFNVIQEAVVVNNDYYIGYVKYLINGVGDTDVSGLEWTRTTLTEEILQSAIDAGRVKKYSEEEVGKKFVTLNNMKYRDRLVILVPNSSKIAKLSDAINIIPKIPSAYALNNDAFDINDGITCSYLGKTYYVAGYGIRATSDGVKVSIVKKRNKIWHYNYQRI